MLGAGAGFLGIGMVLGVRYGIKGAEKEGIAPGARLALRAFASATAIVGGFAAAGVAVVRYGLGIHSVRPVLCVMQSDFDSCAVLLLLPSYLFTNIHHLQGGGVRQAHAADAGQQRAGCG